MSEKLKWIFEIGDKFSGPLKRMQKGLDAFQGKAKKAAKGAGGGSDGGSLFGGGLLASAGALGAVTVAVSSLSGALGSLLGLAGRAGSALGSLTYEAGAFAFEAGAFKESNVSALKTVLGSSEEANKFFDKLVDFSIASGVNVEQFVTAGKNLRAFGLDYEDTMALLRAGGDLAAFSGGSKEATQRIFEAIGQINAKDKLAAEELVGQLAERGLSSAKVYQLAAVKYKTTVEKATKMFQTGQIKGKQGLFFVTEAIKQTASGGKLGSLMEAQAKTAGGLMTSLESRAKALFFDFNETEGYDKFKGFLENVNKALDPNTGPGARVKKAANGLLSDIFGATFGGLSGVGGDEFIANFAIGALSALGNLFKGIRSFFGTAGDALGGFFRKLGGGDLGAGINRFMMMIASGLNAIIALAEKLVGAITPVFDLFDAKSATGAKAAAFFETIQGGGSAMGWITNPFGKDAEQKANAAWTERINAQTQAALAQSKAAASAGAGPGWGDTWRSLGVYAGQGLAAGLLGQQAAALLAGQGLAGAAVEGARAALDVHSPSRVFERLGIYSTQGYTRGLWGGAADVGDAAGAVFAPDPSLGALGAAAAGGMRGAGAVSVTVNIDASGGGEEIGERVKAATVEGLAEAFERLGLSLGVQPS